MTTIGIWLKETTGESDENVQFLEKAGLCIVCLLTIGSVIAAIIVFGVFQTVLGVITLVAFVTALKTSSMIKVNRAKRKKLNAEKEQVNNELLRLTFLDKKFFGVCSEGHIHEYYQPVGHQLIRNCKWKLANGTSCNAALAEYQTETQYRQKKEAARCLREAESLREDWQKKKAASSSSIRCPKCRCDQVTANKQGFGAGKALGGVVLTGGVGLLAGFIGSGKVWITCLKCGHKWKAGR